MNLDDLLNTLASHTTGTFELRAHMAGNKLRDGTQERIPEIQIVDKTGSLIARFIKDAQGRWTRQS